MLTMFTVPKPFNGHIGLIQTNAIQSWLSLHPEIEVFLLGSEEGTAEIASSLGLRHIPNVECNEYNTPIVSSIFRLAQNAASYQLVCYVNADIILMSDFLPALQSVKLESFLMVGQRWDLELNEAIDFNDAQWESKLRGLVAQYGKLHSAKGIDYFIFNRGLYDSVPPFALGRTAWDNWLVYRARFMRIPVIDATKVITAVHQNHDYGHLSGSKAGVFKGPEAERNRELLGGWEYSFGIIHANWMLTLKGLRRVIALRRLYYQLSVIPVLFPRLRFLMVPRNVLIAFSKSIRSLLHIGVRWS